MVVCSIKNCKNRSENVVGKKIKFLCFPQDEIYLQEWLKVCPVKNPKTGNLSNY